MYSIEAESIVKDISMSLTSLDDFLKNIQLKVISKSASTLEIDLINCHPSIANAIRRILISEIPTIAIHNISLIENDTVFPDEYIAHRLGLIPIFVDPELMEYRKNETNFKNILNFKLNVKNETNSVQNLFSDQILWIPLEGQEGFEVKIQPGVLICKMAPGNSIEIDITAEKGTGSQHAKWSPVSLCSYRLMPKIVLEREFVGDEAYKLQKCFSPGVIEVVNNKAVVSNARDDSMSREIFRHEEFNGSVKILRESCWFCFTIESIALDPMILLKNAILIMISKCKELKKGLHELQQ